jgi:hypothetical protein
MITDINIREFLSSAAEWLSWQEEDITYGLKTPEDAIKLYRYALENEDLPEMADTWAYKDRRRAIGYDPLINAKTKFVSAAAFKKV